MVSHDPAASAYADRLLFLRDGRLLADRSFDLASDHQSRLALLLEWVAGFQGDEEAAPEAVGSGKPPAGSR
jgi:hypothetical protein